METVAIHGHDATGFDASKRAAVSGRKECETDLLSVAMTISRKQDYETPIAKQ
jgi:hypothetical protein